MNRANSIGCISQFLESCNHTSLGLVEWAFSRKRLRSKSSSFDKLVVIGRFFTTSQQRCWRTAATKIAAWALVIGLMVGVGWIWQVDRPLSEGPYRDRERELARTKLLLDYHPHDQNAENF